MNCWTNFSDTHSGGGKLKIEPYEEIYIEAPRKKAIKYFRILFKLNPFDWACECCGENYHIYEYNSLEDALSKNIYDMTKILIIKKEDVDKLEK